MIEYLLKKIEEIYHWVAIVSVSMGFILTCYFGWVLLYPYKIIDFKEGCWQTIKQEYRLGEQLTYRAHYNKYVNVPGDTIFSFEDSIVYQLPEMATNNPIGENDFINNSIRIPDFLPTGKYKLKLTIVYKINPFRNIIMNVQTNEFEIIK